MFHFVRIGLLALLISGCEKLGNSLSASRPVIDRAYSARSAVVVGDTTHVIVEARDLNDEDLDYVWSVDAGNGTLEGAVDQPVTVWRAPVNAGLYQVSIRVVNESGKNRSATIDIQAVLNEIPIVSITSPANGQYIASNQGTVLIQTQTTAANGLDSIKCLVGSVAIGQLFPGGSTSVTNPFPWDVTALAGNQLITVRAWSKKTDMTVVSGEASIQVSIEPVVGKARIR